MTTHYLELRGRISASPTNVIGDVMRHFHARQHLGRAVVMCEEPAEWLQLATRQWLKMSRLLQRQRGGATNAVEILKLTYTITQMQHALLVAKAPHDQPDGALHFVRPGQLARDWPTDGLSLYLATRLPEKTLGRLVGMLPPSALVVDYVGQVQVGDFGLRSKAELEESVAATWCAVEAFLTAHNVSTVQLAMPGQTEVMDDAVDEMLESEVEFLGMATMFQRTLDLARPLRTIPKQQRDRYEAFMVLAHRVRTLSPDAFSPQFLNTYADDTFFLNDNVRPAESLVDAIARHESAGRLRLAAALMRRKQKPVPRVAWLRPVVAV